MTSKTFEAMLDQFAERRALRAGEVIFREGEPTLGVFVLYAGSVRVMSVGGPLRMARAGEIVGLTSALSRHRHDCTAVADTGVDVGFIRIEQFLSLLETSPVARFGVLRMLSEKINETVAVARESRYAER